ncbi:unnamed protein product [Lactuca virosa]|uniref:Uncharacterized protein n=1 Tax=Lactuca virosa TaxID=75947 RepID=A0AAU9LJI8_9ASTR|nr:unnamed protein product [Lactuca virosa]
MAYQSSQKDITDDFKMQRIGNFLIRASRSDRVGLNLMLRERISPNMQDYDNRTALHLAASEGHDSIVELLLHYNGKETNGMAAVGNRENITGDSSSSTVKETNVMTVIERDVKGYRDSTTAILRVFDSGCLVEIGGEGWDCLI